MAATDVTAILARPAVAKYLGELDIALRELPDAHAEDLRDQVRAHIEDALAPGASDADVAATLRRLGPPHELVAGDEAASELSRAVVYTRPSFSGWLGQRSRKWWTAFAAALVLIAAGATAVVIETNVAQIEAGCHPCAFVFPEDRLHLTDPPSYDEDRIVVKQRFGQDQAISFTLSNPSRYAQVLRGGRIGPPAPYTGEPMSLDVSTVDAVGQDPMDGWPQKFTRGDVVIPPHGMRQVVLHLLENSCMEPGGSESFDSLQIRVRALGITRSETAQIGLTFTIVGSGAPGHCRDGQSTRGTFRTSL